MIRAIVTDLDGTVLCHGNGCVTIPESFIVAYRHLTEVLNIPIYPATGRSLHSAEGVLKGVQVDDLVKMKPGVYNDGRLIFTSNTPMPAIEMAFDRKLAKATHEWLRASLGVMSGLWGFSVMARDGQMAFQDAGSFPHQNRLVDEWHEKSFRVNELDDIRDKYESEILEFTLVGEPDALDKIQAHFDETFPHADRACMKGPKGMWLKHISLHSQNKAEGVKELCRQLNLRDDEILVIGDEYNDIEMLRHFPHSIAMGNAPDDVKACAAVVGPSCEDDGWSKAVLDYLEKVKGNKDGSIERDFDTTETITTQA